MIGAVRAGHGTLRWPARCAPGTCRALWAGLGCIVVWLAVGCTPAPRVLTANEQQVIDRSQVEYPGAFELRRYVERLTAPTAMAFDDDGSLLVAQGVRGDEPQIWRFPRGGGLPQLFYPQGRKLPVNFIFTGWRMYGPIGGMVASKGTVYVSHRDADGFGVITALDHKGHHRTLVAGLPAQGDFGVTDLALDNSGRLWFGVGTATNSGVVGTDNWGVGWVREHALVHDLPWHDLFLFGYRFDSPNPLAGLFGPADIAVTGPFQPFNEAFQLRVPSARSGKPNGCICSVSTEGGLITVEGFGIHNPRGIAFDRYNQPFFTNDGMELRGTRPVYKDPDALLRLPPGARPWYGWPDYTADLLPVSDELFQPPPDMRDWMARTGYPSVRALVDERASGLSPPIRDILLAGVFPWMSGAAKMQFAPSPWPAFREGAGNAIVALSGDRAPFSTHGRALVGPGGYRVVRVDVDRHIVHEFIRNVALQPRSRAGSDNPNLLERPIDVKFGPDGALYILDYGRMQNKDGKERVDSGTGQIFRLVPSPRNAPTQPTSEESALTPSH